MFENNARGTNLFPKLSKIIKIMFFKKCEQKFFQKILPVLIMENFRMAYNQFFKIMFK